MEKKKLITGIVAGVIGLALVGTIAYLYVNLDSQRKENKAMQFITPLPFTTRICITFIISLPTNTAR